MESGIRVEIPLKAPSILFDRYKTIGELKEPYPNLSFVKYIYLDPIDNKLKGANPPNELPLVENAYLTIVGTFGDVIKFVKDATSLSDF